MYIFELLILIIIIFSCLYGFLVPPRPIRYKLEKCQFEDKLCPKQYILDDRGFRVENSISCCKFKRQLEACKKLEELLKK